MNKVVREHYPVSKLPADLREGLGEFDTVTVVIQSSDDGDAADDFLSMPSREAKARTAAQIKAQLERIRSSGLPSVSPEEAVRRIRQLRDEWDDR